AQRAAGPVHRHWPARPAVGSRCAARALSRVDVQSPSLSGDRPRAADFAGGDCATGGAIAPTCESGAAAAGASGAAAHRLWRDHRDRPGGPATVRGLEALALPPSPRSGPSVISLHSRRTPPPVVG